MDKISQLKRRRKELEESLEEVVVEFCESEIRTEVNNILAKVGVTNGCTISWDFYEESDDEGGTYYAPTCITIEDDNDDELDLDGLEFKAVSSWSGEEFDHSVRDALYDLFYDWKDDLHKYYITSVNLQESLL